MRINGIYSALGGLQRAMHRAGDAAHDLVAATGGTGGDADILGPMVDLKLATRDVQANAKVFQTQDEMLGTLIDVLA